MSASQSNDKAAKAWLQELKSNRKTQVALTMFVLVAGYLGYQLLAPKISRPNNNMPNTTTRNIVGQPLEAAQVTALQRLPNLAGLYKAGELPSENRMYRDLFDFDTPPPEPPPPPPPQPPPPPKPPPTAEELAATERRAAIDREVRGQPSSFQFIAILQGMTNARQGVFQKGEDIHFFQIGDETTPNWKLVAIGDEEAQFQNTKFGDLKFALKVQSGASGQTSGQQRQVTNLF